MNLTEQKLKLESKISNNLSNISTNPNTCSPYIWVRVSLWWTRVKQKQRTCLECQNPIHLTPRRSGVSNDVHLKASIQQVNYSLLNAHVCLHKHSYNTCSTVSKSVKKVSNSISNAQLHFHTALWSHCPHIINVFSDCLQRLYDKNIVTNS